MTRSHDLSSRWFALGLIALTRTSATHALATCAVATCIVLLFPATTFCQSARPLSLRSKITGIQPMTGIVLWSDHEQVETHRDAISLEFRYCGYDEVVNPAGDYDFSRLDRILDQIASRNHQAVLRFYFCYVGKRTTVPEFLRRRADYRETVGKSENRQTSFCDWSNEALQQFTLEFYEQFAAKYDDDPRIAFLQTGFGLWAEYHIYDGPRIIGNTFPSKTFQRRFLSHLESQFDNLPWSISIDAADPSYSPITTENELLALPFGVFDDSFLCKPHPKENEQNWMSLGLDRWKTSPGGGEFSYYNRKDQRNALAAEGPNGVSFERAAAKFHISYMIGNDQPKYQSFERIKQAGMATGYRFRVTEASLLESTLKLVVTNEGVAPLYRDAFFQAGNRRSQTSLKGLLPGEHRTVLIGGVTPKDVKNITIESDAILESQSISYAADL
ncbi:MAG: DUF4832 domain-containing protein [Planctomycetota bacterium]